MTTLTREKNTLPAIPKVQVSDTNLQRFCDAVTQFCAIHGGVVGGGLDRAVTVREMVNSGFAQLKSGNTVGSGGDSGGSIIPTPPEPEFPVEKPTQPTGFRVISGTTAILLIWDDVNFKGAGSTTIYRASSDDFSQAIVLAETPAAVYSDITDNSNPYWYWIRHTNVNGDQGPLNSASGTKGQAGLLTTNPDGDMMIASELVAFAIYATELTAVHITGGTMSFAGGRFTVDVNGNCTASSLTINPAGYCRSSTFVAGLQGWAIYGDGSVEFNDGVFRGDIYAENGYFKGTVYADKIIGDLVSATVFNVTQVVSNSQGWTTVGTFKVINNNTQKATLSILSLTFDCSKFIAGDFGGWDGTVTWNARILQDGVVVAISKVTSERIHLSDHQSTTVYATLFTPTYHSNLAVKETHTYELQVGAGNFRAQSSGCGVQLFRDGSAFTEA
ncbi:hypothetical protein [Vibrio jasicida]|uniref:hypothetical protein n=1 Tax=Vibrio jasicida TaxID=766224 RepID=UPI0005EE1838|nr:hypothetical protein [Vibrio jasicida]